MTLDPQKRGTDLHATITPSAGVANASLPFDVTQVLWIWNPGPKSIIVNFDKATDQAGTFTVDGGTERGPIGRVCTNLHFKLAAGETGTQAFEAMGLKAP